MKYRVIKRETQIVEVHALVEAKTKEQAIEMAYEGEEYDTEFGGVLEIIDREVIEAEER